MSDMEWVLPEGYERRSGNELYWIIVYPRGDRRRLAVAEMCDGTSYEENDYAIASRKRFRDESEANRYCVELARKTGLVAETSGTPGTDFLD